MICVRFHVLVARYDPAHVITFDVRQRLCMHKYKEVRLQHLNLMAIGEKTILITGRYVFAPFIQLLFCLFGFVFKFPI